MSKLASTAQQAMDKFYQQFKTDDDFWDLGYFKIECLTARDFLLVQEYYATKKELEMAYISGDWVKTETLKVEYDSERELYFAKLPYTVVNFPIDSFNLGVQRVGTFAGTQFDRIKTNESWELKLSDQAPPTVYFWVSQNEIRFGSGTGITIPKKVLADLIPSRDNCKDDNDFIPDLFEMQVIKMVCDSAFQAWQIKNGKIDVTENQNPNKQNESDIPELKKASA